MKYGNKKTVIDGQKFDSKREAERYSELLMLERAGHLWGLERQPRFQIVPTVKHGGITYKKRFYTADFRYWEGTSHIVEEVKGYKKETAYRLRLQLFLYLYGNDYEFRETS
jgi:hypothetical protein